jgi:hypothetical protein
VKDEPAQARKEYEELLNTMGEDADPQLKSRVQALLVSLSGEVIITTHQPEENKK